MLKEKLKEDLKSALKAGDTQRRTVIGMVLSTIKNRELDKRGKLMKAGADAASVDAQSELTDEEIIEALGSEVKKRKESMMTYEQAGRPELAAGEKAELDMLSQYLPEQLPEEEIRSIVQQAVSSVKPADMKEMGRVMASVMPKVKGRADGQIVNRIVKEEMEASFS